MGTPAAEMADAILPQKSSTEPWHISLSVFSIRCTSKFYVAYLELNFFMCVRQQSWTSIII